jgi:hypothetical protein
MKKPFIQNMSKLTQEYNYYPLSIKSTIFIFDNFVNDVKVA